MKSREQLIQEIKEKEERFIELENELIALSEQVCELDGEDWVYQRLWGRHVIEND